MAKSKGTVFFCQNCGYETPKWMGQCPGCGEWNTLVEETVVTKAGSKSGRSVRISDNKVSYLSSVETSETSRIKTGINELDRVLGGRNSKRQPCISWWRSGNRKVNPVTADVQKFV